MKNLMLRGLLNKFGFKLVFDADRCTLTKYGLYVGVGYLHESMFKLNIINNVSSFVYIVAHYLLMFLIEIYYHQLYGIII